MSFKTKKSSTPLLTDYTIKIGDVEYTRLHTELRLLFKHEDPIYQDKVLTEHLIDFDKVYLWLDYVVSDEARSQLHEIIRFMIKRNITYLRAVVD